MSLIQQVLFEVEMDYAGHPYYVSGNAILHALARDLDYDTQRRLRVSHGMFVPGQFGVYPEGHSKHGSGARAGFGSGLKPVEAYDDLFLYRQPDNRWLLDTRPRDALNTHDLKIQGDRPVLGRNTHFDKRTTWYIQAYLSGDEDLLPLDDELLDGLQFGGARNYGYGETSLKDTQPVDLDALDYSRLENADEYLLELTTPYVLSSEQPHADSNTVPWWWDCEPDRLRRREESIVEQRDRYALDTIDHGQVVAYDGDRAVETAKNGIERLGTHSKYGFGELRAKPLWVHETNPP
jgi:hypothetical protein